MRRRGRMVGYVGGGLEMNDEEVRGNVKGYIISEFLLEKMIIMLDT